MRRNAGREQLTKDERLIPTQRAAGSRSAPARHGTAGSDRPQHDPGKELTMIKSKEHYGFAQKRKNKRQQENLCTKSKCPGPEKPNGKTATGQAKKAAG